MKRNPLIADPKVCAIAGVVCMGLGWLLVYDAYDGRGRKQPRVLRPFTWW